MDLRVKEQDALLKQTVQRFVDQEVRRAIPSMEENQFPFELIKKMGSLGLMGIPVPEKHGGAGMGMTSYITAIHEISKASPSLGVILSVHTSVGTLPIVKFGTDDQKERYVSDLAQGNKIGAFALTEESSGSDAGALKMKAVRDGDDYVLSGSKMFITNAGAAEVYVVFASTAPDRGSRGVTAFIVDRNTPGLTVGKKEEKMGMHGTNTSELIFDSVRISKENRLGDENKGLNIALANLNAGRIGIAAQALGIAEGALQLAIEYAKGREQFQKPIHHFQGVSFKLAELAAQVEAARCLVYHAANRYESGLDCKKEVSIAKLLASKAAVTVSTEALQLFGGYGYMKEYGIERYFRDAKVTEIYEGTSEIQRMVIAKQLLN
ncbi:acyl-CoA dehydrogenase family protein [Geomicrobium sp. JCM 19038]|uniref:acyl-CoA dehydrogenase family protein n=1 Tax=Geomicrobium sp. JCM 19038 TaxID=1460635 RepID=UPI00045F48BC|nr:acyl-CoA dehydrogenase family protein [Geomicrobium sp. JCM 19038]GAK07002.1 butyryl-CoA dehydrogenase [Geomicrobium sp. JCM 19038]